MVAMTSAAKHEWNELLGTVQVWWTSPDDVSVDELRRRCLAWLSPSDRARRERLRSDKLRHEHLITRALCRATLSRYTGVDPAAWTFVENENGKPSIEVPGEFTSLRFNLTHTEGLIACAVTRAGEVGVDAENTLRRIDVDQITRHFFDESERALLAKSATIEDRTEKFFELWVVKEAMLKGIGAGVSRLPESIAADGNWQLTVHRPTPNHVAACAIRPADGNLPIPVEWNVADLAL